VSLFRVNCVGCCIYYVSSESWLAEQLGIGGGVVGEIGW